MKNKEKRFYMQIMNFILVISLLLQNFIGFIPTVKAAEDVQEINDATELKSALEGASPNKTLKLVKEITIDSTITLGEGSYTVDLAGHTINSNAAGNMLKIDKETTNLKITNSNSERAEIKTSGGVLETSLE